MTGTALPLLAGYWLDARFGDPPRLPHPVVAIGRLIAFLEAPLRRAFPAGQRGEMAAGVCLVALVVAATAAAAWAATAAAGAVHPLLGLAAETFLCFQALAGRGLADAARRIHAPLARGDLPAARRALADIVGRDTGGLDAPGVVRATVESVAENASDGVAAPLVFFALGGAPLALAYKAVNTMDSMVGYKNARYLYFGRVAARLDDIANYLPARLTAWCLVAAAALAGMDWRRAVLLYRRDRANHPSPNAGHPEAAMAGALGIRLGGPSRYAGAVVDKPHLGDPVRAAVPADILRAVRLLRLASALALALCLGAALWL